MPDPDLDDIGRKLPLPTPGVPLPDLRPDDVLTLPVAMTLGRIYARGGSWPTAWNALRNFGPTGSRFDHHLTDAAGKPCMGPRGIIYLAYKGAQDALTTCVAEYFQRTGFIDLTANVPWFVAFQPLRPLRLLDLHGLWPSRAGISTAIASGPKHRAQAWSRKIYDEYTDLDGVAYPSSMAGHSPAVALFERCTDALPAMPLFHRALADPVLNGPITQSADKLGKGVVR